MDDWKTIITFTLPYEAHLAKGYLDSEGIESMIFDEVTVQMNFLYSNAIGGVKVLVRESDWDRGIEILKKGGYINSGISNHKPGFELIDKDPDKSKCPFCQSDNIGKKKNMNIWTVWIYLLLGVFFPLFKSTYICYDCEKEWRFRKTKKTKI